MKQLIPLLLLGLVVSGYTHADMAAITRAKLTFNQDITTGESKNGGSQYEYVVENLGGNSNCTLSIQTGKPNVTFKKGMVIDFDFGHSPGDIGMAGGGDRETIVSGGWAPSPGYYLTEAGVSMYYYSGVDANGKVLETDDYQAVSVYGSCSIANKSILDGIFVGPFRSYEIPSKRGLIKMMAPYVKYEEFREK